MAIWESELTAKPIQICIQFCMSGTRLLFVDDDANIRATLGAVLERHGFAFTGVGTVREALELITTQRFGVLLSDLNIGEPGDGFTVVSAMRRVQPDAYAFILTGYPDLETAIQAVRSQVDDYFTKPLQVDRLLQAVSATRNKQLATKLTPSRKISQILGDLSDTICDRWLTQTLKDPDLAALPLSEAERSDHIPEIIRELVVRLDGPLNQLSPKAADAARKHGKLRYLQGYTIPQLLFESRVLQQVLDSTIHENLFGIELSTLVADILQIGETLQAMVEIAIRVYQSQIPRSLQTSFSFLYQSPYLGVAISEEDRIVDANTSFLRMVGLTREQLTAGEVLWRKITSEKYGPLDLRAIEQLREFGTCVPYEKEFLLPDGSSLPILTGAVRLSSDPLQWSSYVVNLTEQRALHAAEEKLNIWQAKYSLINHLAHELNNPLAAMTFSLHLLGTHPSLTEDTLKLVKDASEMLDRIATTVRLVLEEVQQ
jgi:PAS domain S-box-containing protein